MVKDGRVTCFIFSHPNLFRFDPSSSVSVLLHTPCLVLTDSLFLDYLSYIRSHFDRVILRADLSLASSRACA